MVRNAYGVGDVTDSPKHLIVYGFSTIESVDELLRYRIRSELKAPVIVRALKSIPDWALTYVTSEQSSMEMADLGHVF